MKPCSRNRKLLAWLAVDELETSRAQAMRTHIEQCEACRGYYESIARLYAGQRAAIENAPAVEPSPVLHHKIMSKVRAVGRSAIASRKVNLGWLEASAVAVCLIVMIVLLVPLSRIAVEKSKAVRQVKNPPIQTPAAKAKDFQPSIAGYRRKSGRSFENLDALLSKEGQKSSDKGESLDISTLLQ